MNKPIERDFPNYNFHMGEKISPPMELDSDGNLVPIQKLKKRKNIETWRPKIKHKEDWIR